MEKDPVPNLSMKVSPKATDPAWPGLRPDDLCFQYDEGIYGEVRDASTTTRGQAIAFFAGEAGCDFTDVRCVVRYVLIHTRQDVWDGPGKDRWVDDEQRQHLVDHGVRPPLGELFENAPAEPPEWWEPSESMACWSVCRPDHPRAIKCWMLEVKGDDRIPEPPEARSDAS